VRRTLLPLELALTQSSVPRAAPPLQQQVQLQAHSRLVVRTLLVRLVHSRLVVRTMPLVRLVHSRLVVRTMLVRLVRLRLAVAPALMALPPALQVRSRPVVVTAAILMALLVPPVHSLLGVQVLARVRSPLSELGLREVTERPPSSGASRPRCLRRTATGSLNPALRLSR